MNLVAYQYTFESQVWKRSHTIRAQLRFFVKTESHPKGDNGAKSKAGPVRKDQKKNLKSH